MYSGISGMKNFQTKLDVIGNNIANVNTYGFKKGRVTFKDAINQSISGASAAGDTLGGKNAIQVGLGSQLATIDTVHTGSSLQTTGRSLDIGIDGDGYFVLGEKDSTSFSYTRSGNFYINESGYLVNGEGLYVKGNDNADIQVYDPTGGQIASYSIGSSGEINVVGADGQVAPVATIGLATFSNTSGLTKVGNNLFQESANSGVANIGTAGVDGHGTVASGFLEMSNVDLSEEFTDMIVAQRGFQANTRIITTSDEILQELVNLKR
jgi:flagellar hook protein FlgE